MKLNKIPLLLGFVLFVAAIKLCGQTSAPLPATNVYARLTISLTNASLVLGQLAHLQCRIENNSTNHLSFRQPLMLRDDTHLFLINASLEIVELTPPRILGSAIAGPALDPAQSHCWIKTFSVPSSHPPGEYRLKASRSFTSKDGTNFFAGKITSEEITVLLRQ